MCDFRISVFAPANELPPLRVSVSGDCVNGSKKRVFR